MSLRDAINKNKALGIILGIVILSAAAYLLFFRSSSGPGAPTHEWYWDVGQQKLFLQPLGTLPPVAAPSGATLPDGSPAGVRAHVFSCTSCSDEKSQFIAYIETIPAEAKVEASSGRPADGERAHVRTGGYSRYVATQEGKEWYAAETLEGATIMNRAVKECEGKGEPVRCTPAPQ